MEKQTIKFKATKKTADDIRRVMRNTYMGHHLDLSYDMQELSGGSVMVTLFYKDAMNLFLLGKYCGQ
ncbi:MAG: hypothetical protein A3K54_00175 [Omnitrophica WOR_2 bacterium RBG_13_44_8]|nr:MAG: hypothetical protein A3K54_00175 [Omnitrophica WOR_2 bacterium RBG_13_44_8]